ncbi:MAG: ergothioneine biosynthesis protein EgtB [Cellvibrionaceae bacterium]
MLDPLVDSLPNNDNETVERFISVRLQTEHLASPLSEADAQLQSMPDASPAKWHLAHTTWFFETFILCEYDKHYQRFDESYNYLFNSYYNGIGEQYPRHQRGLISRPSLKEVLEYRRVISSKLLELAESHSDRQDFLDLIELGIQHEQQHQELFLTDIKHALYQNPTFPAYQPISLSHQTDAIAASVDRKKSSWLNIDGGMHAIGYDKGGFSFDNERPRHQVYLLPFQLHSTLISNGEYLEFLESGAYQSPEFWLADAWSWLQSKPLREQGAPLYWLKQGGEWFEFSLHGLLPLNPDLPAIHINYYEASAYAAWRGARLPTEFEWETALQQFVAAPEQSRILPHPEVQKPSSVLADAFGSAWQWTQSSYSAYPGFKPFEGLAGEYNGKFMSNQNVLRGSSYVTPVGHARMTYRNFFYAPQSWQFSGVRLAKNNE